MSAIVIRIGKIGIHPRADNLQITTVNGRSTIFPKGDYRQDDLAVYIEPGTVVPCERPEFRWLTRKSKFKVRKKYIRGIPSYGFLIPWVPGDGGEGSDISADLDIEVKSIKLSLWTRFWDAVCG